MGNQHQALFVGGVLAAGRGSRLKGRQKPFLWWQDGFLLEHATRVLQAAGAHHVILVMQPRQQALLDHVRSICHALRAGQVSLVNPTNDGLSGSVQALYSAFENYVSSARRRGLGLAIETHLIVHQVDRPHVKSDHILRLVDLQQSSAGYLEDMHIVPPLKLPPGLSGVVAELKDDQGMGALFRQNRWRPEVLLRPEPEIPVGCYPSFFNDVDTAADAIRLLQSSPHR